MIENIGKYQIIEEDGKDGMGAVCKANNPLMQRNAAITVLLYRLLSSRKPGVSATKCVPCHIRCRNIAIIHDQKYITPSTIELVSKNN